MLFASAGFMFLFLPVFLLLFMLSPDKSKKYVLFIAGLVFYVVVNIHSPLSIVVLWFAVLFQYFWGLLLSRFRRRPLLAIGVGVDVGVLLLLRILCNQTRDTYLFLFPVGASIYLLCAISYLVEHYRAREPMGDTLFDAALYLTFFPVMMAGPIIRYKDFRQYIAGLTYKTENFARGVRFFCMGMVKRIAVAAVLTEAYDNILHYSSLQVHFGIGLLSFSLMYLIVFFAFSGYSDMGVGLCVMMGMPLSPDYRQPFAAVSLSDYFHHFFISFYQFFEDYVIEPLGRLSFGSLRLRRTLGELIFLVCLSLWVRTDWPILVTVLPILLFVLLENLTGYGHFVKKNTAGRIFGHLFTLILLSMFWTMQRLDDFRQLWAYLQNLWQVSGSYQTLYTFVTSIGTEFILVAAVAVFVLLPISASRCYLSGKAESRVGVWGNILLTAVLLGLFLLTLLYYLPQYPQYAIHSFSYFVI